MESESKTNPTYLIWEGTNLDTEIEKFKRFLKKKYNLHFDSDKDLHQWSVDRFKMFWEAVWIYFDVISSRQYKNIFVKTGPSFLDNKWFSGALFNYAENILRIKDHTVALVYADEEGNSESITFADLFNEVELYAAAFRKNGLQKGDRVACHMSNRKEAVFAMLATQSIGAVWGAAIPYFGARAAANIISQMDPKFLIAVDRYPDNGKDCDILSNLPTIVNRHPRKERRMSEARSQTITDVIKSCISKKNNDLPFYVADFSDVVYKCRLWKSKLPRVEPFYAVKCNSDPLLLQLLVSLGMRFDCASKGEIDAVLAAGADPSDVIYAHPFKSNTFLRYAAAMKVDLMTFDSELELVKIKRVFPNARLILRIQIPDVKAAFPLSDKFGCELKQTEQMLLLAHSLNLNVVGVSFHVGSLCEQPYAYSKAISMAKEVFHTAEDIGYHFTILDIGGGYPGSTGSQDMFNKMAYYINESLEEHFPEDCGVRVIAEPGCYVACSAYTLCIKILGKKIVRDEDSENNECFKSRTKCLYYMNDGAYGSFGYGFEKYGFRIKPLLTKSQLANRPLFKSKLWGASCCSSDCIIDNSLLPDMEVGEYIVFDNMGAYTQCLTTNFNGFPTPITHYVFPPQIASSNDKLLTLEDFCRELKSHQIKAFIKLQDFICHDDSNDDLFRKG